MAAFDPDLLSALRVECCGALSPPVPDDLIVPQDGYAVWRRVFAAGPVAAPDTARVERPRDGCAGYPACPAVSAAAVESAASRTLARWPASDAETGAAADRGRA